MASDLGQLAASFLGSFGGGWGWRVDDDRLDLSRGTPVASVQRDAVIVHWAVVGGGEPERAAVVDALPQHLELLRCRKSCRLRGGERVGVRGVVAGDFVVGCLQLCDLRFVLEHLEGGRDELVDIGVGDRGGDLVR